MSVAIEGRFHGVRTDGLTGNADELRVCGAEGGPGPDIAQRQRGDLLEHGGRGPRAQVRNRFAAGS